MFFIMVVIVSTLFSEASFWSTFKLVVLHCHVCYMLLENKSTALFFNQAKI